MTNHLHQSYQQIKNPILREQYRQIFEQELNPSPLPKRFFSFLTQGKVLTSITFLCLLIFILPLGIYFWQNSQAQKQVLSAKIEVDQALPKPTLPQAFSLNLPSYTPTPLSQVTVSSKKQIIGFLPYWTVKENPLIKHENLTQIAYFGVAFDADGNIKAQNDDGSPDPGWLYLDQPELNQILQAAKTANTQTALVARSMNNDDIASLVNDGIKREVFLRKVLNLIKQKKFDSLNLDFEYAGSPLPVTIKNFTRLCNELKEALLKINPSPTLTIDVFADSAQKVRLYDLKNLKDIADYLIIMGYDIYRPNSDIAAPSAPLGPSSYFTDYLQTLASFLKIVPAQKIILAVPYYGYEWQTTTTQKNAPTLKDSGALATYKRVKELQKSKKVQLFWDNEGQTPWLTYQEDGKIQQIHFENVSSLSLKYDLINELNLAGVAIWALGYDSPHLELWQLLHQKFPRQ
jgi:spore germination protein YaaH